MLWGNTFPRETNVMRKYLFAVLVFGLVGLAYGQAPTPTEQRILDGLDKINARLDSMDARIKKVEDDVNQIFQILNGSVIATQPTPPRVTIVRPIQYPYICQSQ